MNINFQNKSSRDIAIAFMDVCHKSFNENNFSYYKYSLVIYYQLCRALKDKLITQNQFAEINDELESLINECIHEMKGDNL